MSHELTGAFGPECGDAGAALTRTDRDRALEEAQKIYDRHGPFNPPNPTEVEDIADALLRAKVDGLRKAAKIFSERGVDGWWRGEPTFPCLEAAVKCVMDEAAGIEAQIGGGK